MITFGMFFLEIYFLFFSFSKTKQIPSEIKKGFFLSSEKRHSQFKIPFAFQTIWWNLYGVFIRTFLLNFVNILTSN